jgi:hypothetical protein
MDEGRVELTVKVIGVVPVFSTQMYWIPSVPGARFPQLIERDELVYVARLQ